MSKMKKEDIDNLKVNDIINPNWLDTYHKQIEALWLQAVEFNVNLFLLEKINNFPFHLFVNDYIWFWYFIANSLHDSCTMVAWRIAVDNKSDVWTVRRLKNSIIKNTINEAAKTKIRKKLKEIKFNKKISSTEKRVNDHLRSRWLWIPAKGR